MKSTLIGATSGKRGTAARTSEAGRPSRSAWFERQKAATHYLGATVCSLAIKSVGNPEVANHCEAGSGDRAFHRA